MQQRALAESVAQSLDSKLQMVIAQLSAVAVNVPREALLDSVRAQRFLDQQQALLALLDNGLLLVSANGRVVAESPPSNATPGRDVTQLDVFKGVTSSGMPYVSRPFRSMRLNQMPAIAIGIPIKDENGQIIGRLHGSVALLGNNFLTDVVKHKIGATGYMYLVDSNRTVVLHTQRERIMTPAAQPGQNPMLDKALAGLEGSGRTTTSFGLKVLVTFKGLQSTRWTLGVSMPEDEVFEPFERSASFYLVLCLMATLLLVWFLRLTMASFLKPLEQITRHVNELTEKTGTARLLPQFSNDEVGQLATSFNAMLQALDASERRFRIIFEAFPYPIVLNRLDDGIYLDVNPAFCKGVGKPREQIIGQSLRSMGYDVDSTQQQEQLDELRRSKALHAARVRTVAANGEENWTLYSNRIIELNGEEIVLSVTIDISDVVNSEQKLQAIFNASPAAMVVSDLSNDYAVVGVNNAWARQFQYAEDEALGRNGAELGLWAHEADREAIMVQVAGHQDVQGFETTCLRKDGTPIICRVDAKRLKIGSADLLIMVQLDITEIRQAEASLRASEKRLQLLNAELEQRVEERTRELSQRNSELAVALENTHRARIALQESEQRLTNVMNVTGDGIWDWDIASGTLYNNARWCVMLGYDPADTLRRVEEFVQLLFEEDLAEMFAQIKESQEGRKAYRHEHRMRRRDGTVLWVMDRGDVVERDANGRALRMVGSVSDITDRKLAEIALVEAKARAEQLNVELTSAMEELRQAQSSLIRQDKMAALGALVAGVSHELNTPLGNAVTASSTLRDEQRKFAPLVERGMTRSALKGFVDTVAEAAEILERNLERAVDLIGSFKQVAVDQSGFNRRSFDLSEVVHEVLTVMRPAIRASRVEVNQNIVPGLMMDSYPGSLGQVLMNLINNTLLHAFVDQDPGSLTISTWRHDDSSICISVKDDGRGVPIEHQSRVFDPFFTTRLGQGGSGLGLNIAFNIVRDLLGGNIELISAPGIGAEFKICIPTVAPSPQVDGDSLAGS